MQLLVLGATGRVGDEAVRQAVVAGHEVTAFVRDPRRLRSPHTGVHIVVGDIYDPTSLDRALAGQQAVLMAVGADPLKPSTLVGDTCTAVVSAMQRQGVSRYVGVSGTAEMPHTPLGAISIAVLRRTPVGNAVRDHDAAYKVIATSNLDWTLAGCPYIKDGPTRSTYKTCERYPGGFKVIHPGDVAHFLVKELSEHKYPRRIIGIWY